MLDLIAARSVLDDAARAYNAPLSRNSRHVAVAACLQDAPCILTLNCKNTLSVEAADAVNSGRDLVCFLIDYRRRTGLDLRWIANDCLDCLVPVNASGATILTAARGHVAAISATERFNPRAEMDK
jgi:hypothetical protein